jgi:hypothetical protein
MAWRKLGLICALEPAPHRATTHMQGPVAAVLDDRIRVYFAARNVAGKSYPAYLDVDRADPTRLLQVHEQAVVPPGPIGTFDDDGNMPACVVRVGAALWLYYSGWNARITVPYHNTTGIAVSHDGGSTFQRMFDGPILDRTPREPFMAVTPWVAKDKDAWRMWYVSGLGWHQVAGRLEPLYALMSATSADGIEWRRSGALTVARRHEHEAIARPTVLVRGQVHHMWYCYRDSVAFRDGAGSYRIGYARSADGETWQRQDQLAGIDVSPDGWDSSMICYPYVVECDGRIIMFYSGNGFGQTGVGCAVWEGPLP